MSRPRSTSGAWRPALDFATTDVLVRLGWTTSVRTAQQSALAAYALALPACAVLTALIAALAKALLAAEPAVGGQAAAASGATGHGAWFVVAVLLVLQVHLTASYWFRESYSARRLAVHGSPHTPLLRALDVRPVHLFVAVCGVRAVAVFSLATIATGACCAVFVDALGVPLALALTLLPPTSCLWVLTSSARRAAGRGDALPLTSPALVALAVLLAAVGGLVVVRLLAQVTDPVSRVSAAGLSATAPAETGLAGVALGGVALGVVGTLTVASALLLRRALRVLSAGWFDLEPTSEAVEARRRPPRSLLGVLHRELRASRRAFVLQRTAILLTLLVALAAGARAAGTDLLPLTAGDWGVRLVLLAVLLVTLSAHELVLHACGPTTLRDQLRQAWDAGAPVPRMLPAAIGYWLLPGLVVGAAASAVSGLLLDRLDPGPLLLGAGAGAAALLAGALSSAPRTDVDGSADTSVFAALLTVALSVPVLLLLIADHPLLTLLALVYVLALIGGATSWVTRRVRHLPCASPA